MASAQQRLDLQEGVIQALQASIAEITQTLVGTQAALATTAAAEAQLRAHAEKSWTAQDSHNEVLSKKIESMDIEAVDLKRQIAQLESADVKMKDEDKKFPRWWNLEHKGALDKFDGERAKYRSWAKSVKAFCNSKQSGFRAALTWAEKREKTISAQDLSDTNWEFVAEANVKLYDLLVIITKQDALLKVECTHGDEQGFEAWRRLAHQHDPKGALSEIDRLNALTVVTKGSNMRDVLKKVEHWEQQWAKYELDSGDTLSLKLKTGVLLKMLPPKEEREIKLRYVDRPGELSYEVLRRQVENWIDNALDGQGPAPWTSATWRLPTPSKRWRRNC